LKIKQFWAHSGNALTLLGFAVALLGVTALASTPEIVKCTKSPIDVSIGDKITLKMATKEVAFASYWLHDEVVKCTDDLCTMETSDWGVGRHLIYGVSSNPSGHSIVEITARVFKPAYGKAPETIAYEVNELSCPYESISNDALTAQVRRGYGMIDDGRDSRVLNRLARRLKWTEVLRSPDDTVVRFGNSSSEEHLLLPNSSVQLIRQGDFRYIELREGTLRSRNLNQDSPYWGILVGRWAQISSDSTGDVIVSIPNNSTQQEAFINVIRGMARVMIIKGQSDRIAVEAPEIVSLPAGSQLHIRNGKPPSTILAIDAKLTANTLRLSTPFYTDPLMFKAVTKFVEAEEKVPQSFRRKSKKSGPKPRIDIEPWIISASLVAQPEDKARSEAQKMIEANDALAALELALPHEEQMRKDFAGALLLARIYRKIGEHNLALMYYNIAIGFDPQDAAVQFEFGEMMMLQRNWKAAAEAFRKARNRSYGDNQHNMLNMGISEFFQDKTYYAKNSLLAAISSGNSQPAKDIAQRYIQTIEDRKMFYVTMMVGSLYDNNIFRVDSSRKSVSDIETIKASGYEFFADLRMKAFKSEIGSVNFFARAHDHSYLDAMLDPASKFTTDFSADFRAEVYNWDNDRHFGYFTLTPRFKTISFGEARSADVISYKIEAGPQIGSMSLFLNYRSETWMDPFPARDDVLDPDIEEVVLANDRSRKASDAAIGWWIERKQENWSKLTVSRRQAKLTDPEAAVDDYTRLMFDWTHWQRKAETWAYGLDLSFWKRDFASSEDARKDTGLLLSGVGRFYLTNSLAIDGKLSIERQSSNRKLNTYQKIDLMGSILLEL
jgi:hypothetical protein